MEEAGIDVELFKCHSIRGATATKHLEDGADEIDVMARGASTSVFRTFYTKTKHKKITLERLRQAQCGRELDNAPRHGKPEVGDEPSDGMGWPPSPSPALGTPKR